MDPKLTSAAATFATDFIATAAAAASAAITQISHAARGERGVPGRGGAVPLKSEIQNRKQQNNKKKKVEKKTEIENQATKPTKNAKLFG